MNQGEEKVQNAILFITDLIGLIASYYIAGYLWLALWKNVSIPVYFSQMGDSLVSVVVSYMLAFLFYSKNNDFLQRGKFEELKAVVHLNVIMACIIAIYELLKRTNQQFPRGVYVLVVVFNIVLAFIIRRIVRKSILSHAKLGKSVNRVVAITTSDRVDGLKEIEKWNTTKQISGIIIVDRDMRGTEINGIPVVADVHDMIAYIKGGIVDEVYIDLNTARMEKITSLVMELEEMGVVVHLHLNTLENYKDFDMSLGKLGNIPVATFANRFYDYKELAFKRIIRIRKASVIFQMTYGRKALRNSKSLNGTDGEHGGGIEMANKIVREIIHAKGIDIGIYTKDFENEYISLFLLSGKSSSQQTSPAYRPLLCHSP